MTWIRAMGLVLSNPNVQLKKLKLSLEKLKKNHLQLVKCNYIDIGFLLIAL